MKMMMKLYHSTVLHISIGILSILKGTLADVCNYFPGYPDVSYSVTINCGNQCCGGQATSIAMACCDVYAETERPNYWWIIFPIVIGLLVLAILGLILALLCRYRKNKKTLRGSNTSQQYNYQQAHATRDHDQCEQFTELKELKREEDRSFTINKPQQQTYRYQQTYTTSRDPCEQFKALDCEEDRSTSIYKPYQYRYQKNYAASRDPCEQFKDLDCEEERRDLTLMFPVTQTYCVPTHQCEQALYEQEVTSPAYCQTTTQHTKVSHQHQQISYA